MVKAHTNTQEVAAGKELKRIAVTVDTLIRKKLKLQYRLLGNPEPIERARVIQYLSDIAKKPGGSETFLDIVNNFGLSKRVSRG